MNRNVLYALLSLALIVIQTTIARLLTLEDITPDVLIIWIVYLGLTKGQLQGTVWGFCIGLGADLVSGSFLGLSALTKTLAGFLAGYFYNENKTLLTLGSYRFLLVVLLVSFLHNTLYFLVFTQGTEIGLWQAIFRFGMTTTLYTASLSAIPMFAFSRRVSLGP